MKNVGFYASLGNLDFYIQFTLSLVHVYVYTFIVSFHHRPNQLM